MRNRSTRAGMELSTLPDALFQRPAISCRKWEMWLYSICAEWCYHLKFHLELLFQPSKTAPLPLNPHAFFVNWKKHAFLAHEQSFPYVTNDALCHFWCSLPASHHSITLPADPRIINCSAKMTWRLETPDTASLKLQSSSWKSLRVTLNRVSQSLTLSSLLLSAFSHREW